jgi:hypothetical protein
VCLLLAEGSLAVDVGRDDLADSRARQHGLVAGADRKDFHVVAKQPLVLEEQRQHCVLPVLAVLARDRLEAGNDVVDSRLLLLTWSAMLAHADDTVRLTRPY